MKTANDELRMYLNLLDQLLDAEAPDRRRRLEEVEGHLCDAIEHRVAAGADLAAATRAAIEEFGPASEAVEGLSRSGEVTTTRWTHWLPVALPCLLAVTAVIGAVYYATKLANGTDGETNAARTYLQSTVLFGGIAAAGWVWLRQHRRPRTVSPAWLATVAAAVVVVV